MLTYLLTVLQKINVPNPRHAAFVLTRQMTALLHIKGGYVRRRLSLRVIEH